MIPKKLRHEDLMQVHDGKGAGGHLGINKTYNNDKLVNRYSWPNAYNNVVEWLKTCVPCQKKKGRHKYQLRYNRI